MSMRYPNGGFIAPGFNPALIPGAPTIGTATAGNAQATVTFTAPTDIGGSAITSYQVVSTPGNIIATGSASPITVTGLSNGTAYTFRVAAVNSYGAGTFSVASNSVTPAAPPVISDVYNTTLYTGNATPRSITNGINLSGRGGLVWIKSRNSGSFYHNLYDTARGATNAIASNVTTGTVTSAQALTAFNSNGFSLGTDADGFGVNINAIDFVSWTFREEPKFFDIVTFTGNGSSQTINHNLGSTPGMIIVKSLSAAQDWFVWHTSISSQYLYLNTPDPAQTFAGIFGTQTSTTFNVGAGGSGGPNVNGRTYVAYLFATDAGGFGPLGTDNVISCGSYTGNGSSSGPIVTLGFEPQWLLIKRASTSNGGWVLIDTARGMSPSGSDTYLQPNNFDAESTTEILSPTSTGFQINSVNTMWNTNGTTFVYMAIRKP